MQNTLPKTNDEISVAVWMVTFNHERYIKKALESVLNQITSFPFQIYIRDDHSKDNTCQICKEFKEKFKDKIVLLDSGSNLGATKNAVNVFNICFNSNASYIALLEGDDYWSDNEKLEKQVCYLEKNSEYVATFHTTAVVNSKDQIIRNEKSSFLYQRDYKSSELQQGAVLSIPTLVFRNVLKRLPNEYENVQLGDKFLCSLLGSYGGAKFMADIKPSYYRIHCGGIWSDKSELDKEKSFINSHYWMWQYYQRIGEEQLANHFFKLILKKGNLSSVFKRKDFDWLDKLEYLSLWILRRIFRLLRYVFR